MSPVRPLEAILVGWNKTYWSIEGMGLISQNASHIHSLGPGCPRNRPWGGDLRIGRLMGRALGGWRNQGCAAGKAKLQCKCNCEPQPIQQDFLHSWDGPLKLSQFRQGWSLKRGIISGKVVPLLKAIPRERFRYGLWAANIQASGGMSISILTRTPGQYTTASLYHSYGLIPSHLSHHTWLCPAGLLAFLSYIL